MTFVAFVGSRGYKNYDAIAQTIAALPTDSIIVVGTNRGVDTFVANEARRRGKKLIVASPGPVRNAAVRRLCDRVEAFGTGNGCKKAVEVALSVGLPVNEHKE
jgi:hypothetical protein